MNTKKMIASIILIIILALGGIYGTSFAKENSTSAFMDMPNDWSTKALENAVAEGFMKGENGKIMPNDNLTRAEMATIIVHIFGATQKGDISGFVDVRDDDWFKDYLAIAYDMGVIKGSDNQLKPNDPITRQEAFVIIARAIKLEEEDTISTNFTDENAIVSWASGQMNAVINAGYIKGSDGMLNPESNITRAEFAQVLDNVFKEHIKSWGTVKETKKGNVVINSRNVTLENLTIDGDLIIAEGTRTGEITLDNVIITGRLVIKGAGIVNIDGNSEIPIIIVAGNTSAGYTLELPIGTHKIMYSVVGDVYKDIGYYSTGGTVSEEDLATEFDLTDDLSSYDLTLLVGSYEISGLLSIESGINDVGEFDVYVEAIGSGVDPVTVTFAASDTSAEYKIVVPPGDYELSF